MRTIVLIIATRIVKGRNMSIKKLITGLTLSLVLACGGASAADFSKGLDAFNAGDYKTTLSEWIPLAEQGDVYTQHTLGVILGNGNDAIKDIKSAVKWYTLAAEQGYADSQYNLGVMYDNGEGVPENDKTAVEWYKKAAKQGNDLAQKRLGCMYSYGKGVLENDTTSAKWYTLAAKQGDARAQSSLGSQYRSGEGVLKDNQRAYMWFSTASFNGNQVGDINKSSVVKEMTPADVSKAQAMSSLCLESNYTDC